VFLPGSAPRSAASLRPQPGKHSAGLIRHHAGPRRRTRPARLLHLLHRRAAGFSRGCVDGDGGHRAGSAWAHQRPTTTRVFDFPGENVGWSRNCLRHGRDLPNNLPILCRTPVCGVAGPLTMADSQKTEQPTKKRQDKAREEGQFPSAKQFVGGVQFCAFVFMLQSYGWDWMNGTVLGMRGLLKYAFNPEVNAAGLFQMSADLGYRCVMPLLTGGAALVLLTLAVQLGITKLGLSVKKLLPDPKRMNPISKLKQLPGQNLPAMLQALILLPLFGGAIYAVGKEHVDTFMLLPRISVASEEGQQDQCLEHCGQILARQL